MLANFIPVTVERHPARVFSVQLVGPLALAFANTGDTEKMLEVLCHLVEFSADSRERRLNIGKY